MTKAEELYNKYPELFEKYKVNNRLRLSHFFGRGATESNLESKRESCYYTTIKGLRDTFKTPFKNKSDEFVSNYLKNTEKCSNYVYANREGNRGESTGDGFKYRGGGIYQNTFYNGYLNLKNKTGIDFIKNPDLILEERNALWGALIYWDDNKLNQYADKDDLDTISDIVNIGSKTKTVGDAHGYDKTKSFVEKYKKIFK